MSTPVENLKNFTGMVAEVEMHKAIIVFGHEGDQEHALLKKEKLTIRGQHVRAESLPEVLPVGSIIKFWCYKIPEIKSVECAWFVTHAIKQDSCQFGVSLDSNSKNSPGCVNQTADFLPGLHQLHGTIFEMSERHGVIAYDTAGENRVYFTAHKLVLFGKTVDQNQKLPEVIQVGDLVYFDAMPMHSQGNVKSCSWFATLVWKGRRPNICKSEVSTDIGLKHLLTDGSNLQQMLYQFASDPNAMFVKTEARVMFLINNEFGVAMLLMKHNISMSALFHRSVCYLLGHSLKHCNLQKFLKEGDHIKFVGVEAPPGLISKFVATHIVIGKAQ
ncbi:uncharacterized protein LOC134535583 [Bacillus rossius redtenbacheri]|uniref:uncharacterized protein LOC134535583 n=1 Tax=Bacillus rossius redtenbacheri TaxID=93214 RepID=UPI002FDDFC8E